MDNKPRDLEWDVINDTPAVMQEMVKFRGGIRITWNPDDNRFYMERRDFVYGEWHTYRTFVGSIKGWYNATGAARRFNA